MDLCRRIQREEQAMNKPRQKDPYPFNQVWLGPNFDDPDMFEKHEAAWKAKQAERKDEVAGVWETICSWFKGGK
jgi:hypothetical protein